MKPNETDSIAHALSRVTKEVNHLAVDDVASVIESLDNALVSQLTENPYRALLATIGIGFGLRALNRTHAKQAALQVGKLIAIRALSNLDRPSQALDSPNPGTDTDDTDNEGQTHEQTHEQKTEQVPA